MKEFVSEQLDRLEYILTEGGSANQIIGISKNLANQWLLKEKAKCKKAPNPSACITAAEAKAKSMMIQMINATAKRDKNCGIPCKLAIKRWIKNFK
jgi:hypothetical protein